MVSASHSTAGSPIMKFVVDLTIAKPNPSKFSKYVANYPEVFSQDLAIALMRDTRTVSDRDMVHRFRNSYQPETGEV